MSEEIKSRPSRETGYYWVRFNHKYADEWTVGFYGDGRWTAVDSYYSFRDSDFKRISLTRIKSPDEVQDA